MLEIPGCESPYLALSSSGYQALYLPLVSTVLEFYYRFLESAPVLLGSRILLQERSCIGEVLYLCPLSSSLFSSLFLSLPLFLSSSLPLFLSSSLPLFLTSSPVLSSFV